MAVPNLATTNHYLKETLSNTNMTALVSNVVNSGKVLILNN